MGECPHGGAIDVPSEAEGRADEKNLPGLLIRGRIARTSECRLVLVSVISPALGLTGSSRGPPGQFPCRGSHEECENFVDHSTDPRVRGPSP